MKSLYKTPEIVVEELTKQDVLCSSGEPQVQENQTLGKSIWQDLTGAGF